MITSPLQHPNHPDRGIDCQTAAEDEFLALTERIEAAGWSGDEAAAALFALAKNHVRAREESALDDMRVQAAGAAVSRSFEHRPKGRP